MGLKVNYAAQDEIPETVRENYVERNGKWVLDLEGDDGTRIFSALDKERNDHKTAKQKLAEKEANLTELQKKLELFQQYGSPEELQKMREEIEKAKPAPKLEELQGQLKSTTEKMREYERKFREMEPDYKAKLDELSSLKLKIDRNDADTVIRKTVSAIKGVNADALTDALNLRYQTGILKRTDAGEIVENDNGMSLTDFAQQLASEKKLILPNVSGGSKPGNGGKPEPSKNLWAEMAAGAKT